jgi:hypothetical protein
MRVPVPVVDVRIVRVPVRQRRVPVRMHVRLAAIPGEVVRVLVVLVVTVRMRMLEKLVRMLVFVPLAHVQPDARAHEKGSDPEQG